MVMMECGIVVDDCGIGDLDWECRVSSGQRKSKHFGSASEPDENNIIGYKCHVITKCLVLGAESLNLKAYISSISSYLKKSSLLLLLLLLKIYAERHLEILGGWCT
jgi:hypothetical protein